MKTLAFTLLVVLAMVQLMAKPSEAIPCSQVEGALAPCISYLTSGGGVPSPQCCNGVRSIKSMTPTQADRQSACGCAKAAATRYKTIRDDVAAALPKKCNVQISVPISRNVDCSKIP